MVNGPPIILTPSKPGRKSLAALCEQWPGRLRPRIGGRAVTETDVKSLAVQMAGVKIDDQAKSLVSSATISIGKAVLKAEDALEQFGTSIEFATDVLDSENLADLDDLDEARGTLQELSLKKEALSNFKRKHPGYRHYKVVSFSKLTKKHITDMGVTSARLTQDRLHGILRVFDTVTFEPNSKEFRGRNKKSLPTIFESFWLGLVRDGRFIDDFKIVKKNIGKKPEARARMLTDYVLTQLMVFVDKHLGLIQFMFLELLLSSSSDPVPVGFGSTATLLTGSVDYAILSSADARAALAKTLGVEHDKVEDRIREMTSGSSLDDIIGSKFWPVFQELQHFKFTIIEEKRKDLSPKKLEDCEPQVTGEALALQSKARLDYVQWCLSNGEDWIFGTFDKTKRSRSLPPISICDDDLEGSINKVLKMLILWTLCPMERLRNLLDIM